MKQQTLAMAADQSGYEYYRKPMRRDEFLQSMQSLRGIPVRQCCAAARCDRHSAAPPCLHWRWQDVEQRHQSALSAIRVQRGYSISVNKLLRHCS